MINGSAQVEQSLFLKKLKSSLERMYSNRAKTLIKVGYPQNTKGTSTMSVPATSARIERYKEARKQHRPSYSLKSATSTQPVWRIALKNEMGQGVPKRPFMQKALPKLIELKNDQVKKVMQKFGQDLAVVNIKMVCQIIGVQGVSILQDSITSGSWQANSPFTVAVKQSSKPLVDTGLMRQSITFTVEVK